MPATPQEKQEISKYDPFVLLKLTERRARYSRGSRTRFVTVPAEVNINAASEQVVGAALAWGLYPKILALDPSGSIRTISNQQPVSIVR